MQIGDIVKLDQKNRLHIPQTLMKEAGIEPNGEVVVIYEVGFSGIKIYPKKVYDDIKGKIDNFFEFTKAILEDDDKENDEDDKIKVVEDIK